MNEAKSPALPQAVGGLPLSRAAKEDRSLNKKRNMDDQCRLDGDDIGRDLQSRGVGGRSHRFQDAGSSRVWRAIWQEGARRVMYPYSAKDQCLRTTSSVVTFTTAV
jgi:hypothetical protein